MHTSTFPQICNHSWSCRTSILEGVTFHRMTWCKFPCNNPCMAIETFYHCDSLSSATSGSRRVSFTLLHERTRRRIRLCHFSTHINIVAETAIVSFHTLPVGFTLPTISKNSLSTLFSSLILDHGVSSQNFHFWPQNSYFEFLAQYFFSPKFSVCDNQVLTSSDESPSHTILIRSWFFQTLVFLICPILPRCHQVEISS